MATKLHWANGPWPGQLALAARPRGGDWLEDELSTWRQAGIDIVTSLLTREEDLDLGLQEEERLALAQGMQFLNLPIPDREIPPSRKKLIATLAQLNASLKQGKNVVLHCRQGVGRAGLLASCLLITNGSDAEVAMESLSNARGIPIPETEPQREWIEDFAANYAPTLSITI